MMKLMIVDDHSGIRAMIRGIAAAPGDAVCECADGGEAVRRAGDFAPDCVTMDLRMPGMDGLAAARAIRALRPAVRIVVVTAYDQPELRREAGLAGACGYVPKDQLERLPAALRSGPKPTSGTPTAHDHGEG
jgi:CheY-like chemotaxis protein